MKDNERVYTEATDRLRELHKNYAGAKCGYSDRAKWFDNCNHDGETGLFYAEPLDESVYPSHYKHLTEQEFIDFMGLEPSKDDDMSKAKETLDNLIKNGLPKDITAKLAYPIEQGINHIHLQSDVVNNPTHYTQGSIECLDAIRESMTSESYNGFLKGQVQKYMWRYEKKSNPIEDLKKAEFYLKRLIKETEQK